MVVVTRVEVVVVVGCWEDLWLATTACRHNKARMSVARKSTQLKHILPCFVMGSLTTSHRIADITYLPLKVSTFPVYHRRSPTSTRMPPLPPLLLPLNGNRRFPLPTPTSTATCGNARK